MLPLCQRAALQRAPGRVTLSTWGDCFLVDELVARRNPRDPQMRAQQQAADKRITNQVPHFKDHAIRPSARRTGDLTRCVAKIGAARALLVFEVGRCRLGIPTDSSAPMDPALRYDRQLLLLGPKRNSVLELSEIQRYGMDNYGDLDYVSVYGLKPAEWYPKGIRLLGRTAVECTRDDLARAIAQDIARVAPTDTDAGSLVIDPFAGSANTLYWITRELHKAHAIGFELDAGVFELTKTNLAILELPNTILNADFSLALNKVRLERDELVTVFIAPPWGAALDPKSGLDLRRTAPPIPQTVDLLLTRFSRSRVLFAIQVYERLDEDSVREVAERFDWWTLRRYDLNEPGQNHGLLLGTRRWRPHNF